MSVSGSGDVAHASVAAEIRRLDPDGWRTAQVLRETLDQLYDGQRTGRYRWDQLYKTERTHCGTLVEINLQRQFNFSDGSVLDYSISGEEVDCKYSQSLGGWMIPPEALGYLCLLLWADDPSAEWSLGIVRASPQWLNPGVNRDGKRTLSRAGRAAIEWVYDHKPLPPNVLLQLPRATVDRIMAIRHGTQRLNELFRNALGMRIGRGVVATVAQQNDYMRRIRKNGGSRTSLKPEGIMILGQYSSDLAIARSLAIEEPRRGESIAVRVARAPRLGPGVAEIEGGFWRVAGAQDAVVEAPELPSRSLREP
jgi:hypothetical protein